MPLRIKKDKKKILPKSRNGVHRKHASLGCYQYQKDELYKRAAQHNMSVSYYLNYLLWAEWLEPGRFKEPKDRK